MIRNDRNVFIASSQTENELHRQRLQTDLRRLRLLADLLDSRFKGPYGTSFGLDALIGLVPGVGDVITALLSLYILATAAGLGVSSATLIRMGLNIFFENVVDLMPFLGNLFDFYWKANSKNIKLLQEHLSRPERETIRSRAVVGVVAFFLFCILAVSVWVSVKLFTAFHDYLYRH